MTVSKQAVGKNELTWLADGAGAHGDAPRSPEEVSDALSGNFHFRAERDDAPGLRPPQLGALHALLAARTVEPDEPMTVVMPTGTGKTETMLAMFAVDPQRTLVMVPSDALRQQIAGKFQTLGVLPAAEVVEGDFLTPVVAVMRSGLNTVEECDALALPCNVLVTTSAALAKCSPDAMARLVEVFDQLIVDEAHHVAARTWKAVADAFASKPVMQFTATPFREDGQYMGGKVKYAYPLRLAQRDGYFATINYRAITDIGDADRSLATAALQQLREDLEAGFDHVLMARVNNIPRATGVLELYSEIAPDLNPVRVDSRMAKRAQRDALRVLRERGTRVIVCVDMLGEGFDLPALKVAAIHDPHKSLAVTLQFVGRFARAGGEELGEASVFVPRVAGDLDDRLLRLYGEDSDWNVIIRDLTEAEVAQEQERSDFEAGFGSVPAEVAMRSIQPKMSTVVYRSPNLQWNSEQVLAVFPEEELLTKRIAVNGADHVLWFVTAERIAVPWGEFTTFTEMVHHLYVVHCDVDAGLMYINSSYKESMHDALARAVGGDEVSLIKGDVVYRVLGRVQRRVPTNVGVLDAVNRNRRFSMHVGADVLAGFGPGAAQKARTNIYAHGYLNGSRVSFGASRKGRVWSHRVAPDMYTWVKWARSVGETLVDETISLESVMNGFIIPTAATTRPPLVPLGVAWPHEIVGTVSEARQVSYEAVSHPLIDLNLAITSFNDAGPIEFDAESDDWRVSYRMDFGDDGPVVVPIAGDAEITVPSGVVSLSQFMTTAGLTVFFEKEALLSPDGYLMQPDRTHPRYSADELNVVDWGGVDIQREMQGPDRDPGSIQHRAIELLRAEADWDVIVDDHGSGEAADVVLLRREDQRLTICLVHCKGAGGAAPGARVGDLYEVCGQATKSYKARSDAQLVMRKLLRRETKRQQTGASGFIVGTAGDLIRLSQSARLLDVDVTVVIAQPGLSKAAMTNAQAELLACTELYLNETYSSRLRVLCSD
jgi:superfamily II DNA or RNA helicase